MIRATCRPVAECSLGLASPGLAIENSMLGAAHSLANPLTANFGIPHGEAVGLALPHVIRFNGGEVGPWYRELLECSSGAAGLPAAETGAEGLADFVADLLRRSGLASRLSELNVPRGSLKQLAAEAAQQWTGGFNPRKVEVAELASLYEAAY